MTCYKKCFRQNHFLLLLLLQKLVTSDNKDLRIKQEKSYKTLQSYEEDTMAQFANASSEIFSKRNPVRNPSVVQHSFGKNSSSQPYQHPATGNWQSATRDLVTDDDAHGGNQTVSILAPIHPKGMQNDLETDGCVSIRERYLSVQPAEVDLHKGKRSKTLPPGKQQFNKWLSDVDERCNSVVCDSNCDSDAERLFSLKGYEYESIDSGICHLVGGNSSTVLSGTPHRTVRNLQLQDVHESGTTDMDSSENCNSLTSRGLPPMHSLEKQLSSLTLDSKHHSPQSVKKVSKSKAEWTMISNKLQERLNSVGEEINHSVGSDSVEDLQEETQVLSTHYDKSVNDSFMNFLFEPDEDGDNLLHMSIIHNRPDIALKILNFVHDPSLLNIQNRLYQTVLHLVVLMNHYQLARKLVTWGARLDIQDHNGDTPLHIACQHGKTAFIIAFTKPLRREEISQVPYRVPYYRIPQDQGIRNYDGLTCLHLAAKNGFTDIVNYLIKECGANANAIEWQAGETILHQAVQANDFEMVMYLLCFDEIDLNVRRYDGCTALNLARGRMQPQIIDILEEKGALDLSGDVPEEIGSNLYLSMESDDIYDDFKIGGFLIE